MKCVERSNTSEILQNTYPAGVRLANDLQVLTESWVYYWYNYYNVPSSSVATVRRVPSDKFMLSHIKLLTRSREFDFGIDGRYI